MGVLLVRGWTTPDMAGSVGPSKNWRLTREGRRRRRVGQAAVLPEDYIVPDLASSDNLMPEMAFSEEVLQQVLAAPAVSGDEPGSSLELLSGTRQLENADASYMQGYRSSGVERWVDACRQSRPRAPDAAPCPDEQLTGDARRLQQQAWAAD